MLFEDILTRLLIATLLGGLIGIEREYRNKSAGFRTMILISLGSAMFSILALKLAEDISNVDPSRIISYIIGGIGFLGAGAIIKEGVNVRGLTTSSTIWLVAAVGISAGAGYFAEAIAASVIALVCLIILPYVEIAIGQQSEYRNYLIIVKKKSHLDEIEDKLRVYKIKTIKSDRAKSQSGPTLELITHGKLKDHTQFSNWLIDSKNVVSF